MMSRRNRAGLASILALIAGAGSLTAQEWKSSYTLFGTPGLIEMPTAGRLPDGQVSTTLGDVGPHTRTSLTFQALPRVTGTFRYSRLEELDGLRDNYRDRSFDVQLRLLDETRYRPAVAVGLRDFLGTGVYSSEYIVATKSFGPRFQATAGLGWGRLGSRGGFENPLGVLDDRFKDRPTERRRETGGTLNTSSYFRGDAAFFGGIEYTFSPSLRFKAEYSSDATLENSVGGADGLSPFNFGVTYSPNKYVQLGAYSFGGEEIALSATLTLNPRDKVVSPLTTSAPLPVNPRSAAAAATWAPSEAQTQQIAGALRQVMATERLKLIGLQATPQEMRVRFQNDGHRSDAQAIGRLSRMLTHVAPASVQRFRLELSRDGLPLSQVVVNRADVERLDYEPGAAQELLANTQITDAFEPTGLVDVDASNAFNWSVSPYLSRKLFDPDRPFQFEVGARLQASYHFTPGLSLNTDLRYRVYDNYSPLDEPSEPGDVPVVRTDSSRYGRNDRVALRSLTLNHLGKVSPSVYTRFTVGYLEKMYGGVSGEVLWKPANSRLGLGAELNYAVKRDYDQGFGFQDYNVVTGHASVYYEFPGDYIAQLDVGRYLAGDYGATLTLEREFANGWRLGGYVTLTDIPFEDFGEGSFDKGILISIPMDWAIGQPSRTRARFNVASLTRDGGARLRVPDRLYETVRESHEKNLTDSWGRFWK